MTLLTPRVYTPKGFVQEYIFGGKKAFTKAAILDMTTYDRKGNVYISDTVCVTT